MTARVIVLQDEARRSHALKVIGSLPLDELWAVSIEPYKKQRSSAQNRRYWLLMGMYADKTGYDAEDLHEMMKARFLAPRQIEVQGQSEMIRSSTTKLTTKEFAEYAEKVERWGIETLQVWLDQ